MSATILTDVHLPLELETEEQRVSRSRSFTACIFVFVLGMMVATIGLLTVRHYGLCDARFRKFFFALAVPRKQPASGASGTSGGMRVGNKKALSPLVPARIRTGFSRMGNVAADAVTAAQKAAADKKRTTVKPVKIDIARLVARCVELGEQAGVKMREVQARPSLDIVDKGGERNTQGDYVADVQTAADREVEELCVAALLAEFPGIVVVAEESASESLPQRAASKQDVPGLSFPSAQAALAARWPDELRSVEASRIIVYVDPLDGTGEFVKGNLLPVTNLIGVAVDGIPVAGVINQPWAPGLVSGRTVWGGPGAGVHGMAKLEGKARVSLCSNRVVRSDREAVSLRALGVTPQQDVQRISATGFNLLCVLEGKCDLFVLARSGTKKWDSCAGEALLKAVGGIVTDVVGRRYFYGSEPSLHKNSCGLLAARNRSLHANAAKIVENALAPWPHDVEDGSIMM